MNKIISVALISISSLSFAQYPLQVKPICYFQQVMQNGLILPILYLKLTKKTEKTMLVITLVYP